MNKSFKRLRKFIIIRNLIFFVFKILVSIFILIFIAISALIIILSTRKRTIKELNTYLYNYLNKVEYLDADFDLKNTVVYLNSSLGLRYDIKNLTLNYKDNKIDLPNFSIVFDFSKLFFGKIVINNIMLTNADFDIKFKNKTKDEIKTDSIDFTKMLNDNLYYIMGKSIYLNKLTIKDSKINFEKQNGENFKVKIINSIARINLNDENITLDQNTSLNINDYSNITYINSKCRTNKKDKECSVKIGNLNLNKLTFFAQNNGEFYSYLHNINGLFNIDLNFSIDNDSLKLKDGNFAIHSNFGSFYLKQFFDEDISFSNLELNSNFKDNFKIFNLSSVSANLEDVNFNMNMLYTDYDLYKNVDLGFNIENVDLTKLKKFWPNFLSNENKDDIRPWVIKHITSGKSPKAWAKMNMKYYKNSKIRSGLQDISSEVLMDNVTLDYNNYFPKITNINGLAKFTKNNMLVTFQSGKVLNTKINNGNVFIDFNKEPYKNIEIKANTTGHFSDLFDHIDNSNKEIIDELVNEFVEDYKTNSNINIIIPIRDDLDFNKTQIKIDSTLFNKTNYLLVNSSKIPITFEKKINSNLFYGKIDFTNNSIKYIPLNIYKPQNKSLIFIYKCSYDNGIVNIDELNSQNDYIKFVTSGFLNIKKDIYQVNVENISYNNSKYNLYYDSKILNKSIYNNINIDGRNINYTEFFNKINLNKFKNVNNKKSSNINNTTTINLNLKSLDFSNNKLYNPDLSAVLKNGTLENLEFSSKLENKGKNPKSMKITLNQKKGIYSLHSDDFGKLFNTLNLTKSIVGGSGDINIYKNNKNNKNILEGNLNIDKRFSILTNKDLNKEVLTDIKDDRWFKKLEKTLNTDSLLTFEKMKGNFYYRDNIIFFNEIVTNSKFIGLSILASGYNNLETNELEIKGLIIPLNFINGLFGANKLPIISSLVFGQKNAGLFASNFTVTKRQGEEEPNIEINKFSLLLPGFLRNIFDKNNFKINYDDLFSKN